MIARLLAWLPGWATGQVGPRARRIVKGWTRKNGTLRSLHYGPARRVLLWGGDHPASFALLAGLVSATIALVSTKADKVWARLPALQSPPLERSFDLAAYSGVPWSVQATLVALVYPIVVSFIALMLQRRAHSTVALRVYVLDSAVVPAGASSIGLLLVTGGQYFAAPYASHEHLVAAMAFALVFNSSWLAINVLLTGFFLSRTIRFIQDEESRHSFTRLAVDVVLRAELTAALKQHLVVNAAHDDWGYASIGEEKTNRPEVRLFGWLEGATEAAVDLPDKQVLHEVHLHLLRWVAWSWSRRAGPITGQKVRNAAGIAFPALVGVATSGEVKLCVVKDGPRLNSLERLAVRSACVFRPASEGALSLTTEAMLVEMGSEVESLAEQRRYGAAADALRNLLALHKTLLQACAADEQGEAQNVATINSTPYSWGDATFDTEWLGPYREISRVAVGLLDKDGRLFRQVANVPTVLARVLPPRPEKLIIHGLQVGTNLAYQLGAWWLRRAQGSITPGGAAFGGTLPAPTNLVYERAVIDFIGAWGSLRIEMPDRSRATDKDIWAAMCARATVYASHLEDSVSLFLKAMSRGDEVAATWLYENFIKWWGNRVHELAPSHLDFDLEPRHRQIALSLADKSWEEARETLIDGENAVTIRLAEQALSLAIRRYWERLRLFLALLLIQNAGDTPAADSREIRLAANLIGGRSEKGGGNVEAAQLGDVDAVSAGLLDCCFGDDTVRKRIDAFTERLAWDKQTPEVSGWIYSWSGGASGVSSMSLASAKLLLAVSQPRCPVLDSNQKLVESWWKDLDKLSLVGRYLRDLRKLILSRGFRSSLPAVSALRAALIRPAAVVPAFRDVARVLRKLDRTAVLERTLTLRSLTVSDAAVRRTVERVSTLAFEPSGQNSALLVTIRFVPSLSTEPQTVNFDPDMTLFTGDAPEGLDKDYVENIARHVRSYALAGAFWRYATKSALTPVTILGSYSPGEVTVAQLQSFISAVAGQCAGLRNAGKRPVILVGRGSVSSYLRPNRWGNSAWQAPLPAGVEVRNHDSTRGELAPAYVNEAPVFEFETPGHACYVVALEDVETLRVAGNSASAALTFTWSQLDDEKIRIGVTWRAEMG